jgi:hypothetical protein
VPDFNQDRVYPSDIKKILTWYNLLLSAGITDFSVPDKQTEQAEQTETQATTTDADAQPSAETA